MQLPHDTYYNTHNISILKQTEMIGLMRFSFEKESITNFEDGMEINDIVLIRTDAGVIALVKIISELITHKNGSQADYLKIKRKVEILDFNQFNEKSHLNLSKNKEILQKLDDPSSNIYQYIDAWYNKVIRNITKIKGVKINKVYIKSYKMFQDFNISFTNKEGYITPITIIAGINGSGKTSLLHYIANFNASYSNGDYISLITSGEGKLMGKELNRHQRTQNSSILSNSISYFPVSISKGEKLEGQIKRYINKLVFENDYKPTSAYKKLQNNINDIFSEINLKIEFSGLNREKQALFTNASGNKFSMEALSTGEKTLLTQVLYLYLSDIKDGIILIDEPEISLHPNWQNAVIPLYETFAKRNNNQIIIATHSPHIISGARNGYVKLLHLENSVVSVENTQKNYGIEVSNALTQVMGLEHLRPIYIDNKIAKLKKLLLNNKFDSFNSLMVELEDEIGKRDTDLRMLKIEMNIRNKNAKD